MPPRVIVLQIRLTFVTLQQTYLTYLRLKKKKFIAIATSAVAAQLLRGGRTAHSAFRIPNPCGEDGTCSISVTDALAADIRAADFIIWDEIVMCLRYCIDAVERTLRDIMGNDFPFGGEVFLLCGDFRKILPVVRGGSRAEIVGSCVKQSGLFSKFKMLNLTQNMRLEALRQYPQADPQSLSFPEFLLKVGGGREQLIGGRIELPLHIALVHTKEELCDRVFKEVETKYEDIDWLANRTILTTKNLHLSEINMYVSHIIPGDFRAYLSADSVEDENHPEAALQYTTDFLNTLTAGSALPDHELNHKKVILVMLLRNIEPFRGHVNGARYIINDMRNNVLMMTIATGMHKGKHLALPRMPCFPSEDDFGTPGFKRVQFPIRVCFAITTNKAQGQFFGGEMGLDVRDEFFAHGQLYVALSKTTHPSRLTVLSRNGLYTKNVVYEEALY